MSWKCTQQSKQSLEQITKSVEDSGKVTERVALAAVEQNAGVKEVKQAILDLDKVTQQNASMVEASTAANRSVEKQSATVSSMLDFFVTEHKTG